MFAFLCLCVEGPTQAQINRRIAPVALVLVSNLTYADLSPGGAAAGLDSLAENGMIALLDPNVAGEPSEAAAFLTVGAGVPLMAQAFTGIMIPEAGIKRPLAEVAEDAFPLQGREGTLVAASYAKRYGSPPPAEAVAVHLSLSALIKGQSEKALGNALGGLGERLRRAGKTVAVYGDWRAMLVGMDRQGVAYAGDLRYFYPQRLKSVVGETDVTIVNLTPRELRQCTGALRSLQGVNVIVAAVAPPLAEGGYEWTAPGFLIASGPSFPPKSLPLSASKHLYGFVAATDIAPTLVSLADAGTLPASFGRSLTTVQTTGSDAPVHALSTLYRQITLRDKAAQNARWSGVILLMGALLTTLLAFLWRRPLSRLLARALLCAVASYPLALLITGFIAPMHLRNYLALALVLALFPAALNLYSLRRFSFSLTPVVLLITAAVAAGDIAFGQTLLYRSTLLDTAAQPLFLAGGVNYVVFTAGLGLAGVISLIAQFPAMTIRALAGLLAFAALAGAIQAAGQAGLEIFPANAALAFLFGAAVALMDTALCDFLPWTTEPNASA